MTKRKEVGFEISISGRRDGTLVAVYLQVSNKPVAATREIEEDVLLADHDRNGRLVGIEILAPVSLARLQRLVTPSKRRPLRRFLRQSAPPTLVYA